MLRAINSMKEQRQIMFEMYEHFRIFETEGSMLDFRDLMQVKLNNDQLIVFFKDWGYVTGAMET